jgi:LCP family protein required for cell wall assembly
MLAVVVFVSVAALVLWLNGSLFLLRLLVRPDVLLGLLVANFVFLLYRLFAVFDAYRLASLARRAARRPVASPLVATVSLVFLICLTVAPHVAAAYYNFRSYDLLETVFAETEPQDVLGAGDDPWPLDESSVGPVFLDDPVPRLDPESEVATVPELVGPGQSLAEAVGESSDVKAAGREAEAKSVGAWVRGLAGSKAAKGGGWLNLLLIGGDAGYGRSGLRTDTMIVVAIQAGTGKAVAFGIPRNLENVPLPGEAGEVYGRFEGILNALYGFGQAHAVYFRGGKDPGVTALKQTISQLLGIPIHYYALVDLRGFVEMVDALGGIRVTVNERVQDKVSPPYPGEEWIPIDVYPGQTYEFDGREALAYARSRWATSDYNRMRRQRCLLNAMAQQLSVARILRKFPKIASAVKEYVGTDIPIGRVPDLVELISAIAPAKSVAESFGPPGFSVVNPDVEAIRATVKRMILLPVAELRARYGVHTLRDACA